MSPVTYESVACMYALVPVHVHSHERIHTSHRFIVTSAYIKEPTSRSHPIGMSQIVWVTSAYIQATDSHVIIVTSAYIQATDLWLVCMRSCPRQSRTYLWGGYDL